MYFSRAKFAPAMLLKVDDVSRRYIFAWTNEEEVQRWTYMVHNMAM